MDSQPTPRRPSWLLRTLAVVLSLCSVVLVDLLLRVLGAVPPENPLLLYARTYEQNFSPFVEDEPGVLTIRPDWINTGEVHRVTRGVREGQYFSYPGFRPTRITRVKPADTVRVFVLGGSTAFGLYVGEESAFPKLIERQLDSIIEGRSVEVINLACAGWASSRVANVLDSVVQLEPDLVIVYTGHNELLKGRVDKAAELGSIGRGRSLLLEASTLFAWLDYAMAVTTQESDLIREEVAAIRTGTMLTYENRSIPPELRRAFLKAAEPEFRMNIEDMIANARKHSIPILFVLPAANLLQSPRAPEHASGFVAQEAFETLMAKGQRAAREGDFAEALSQFDRGVALSPEHALGHFARGMTLVRTGETKLARTAFQRALDLDHWTHRITSRLEKILLGAGYEQNVPVVDLRPIFQRDLSNERIESLFVDHVHPTAKGHEQIAKILGPEVGRLLGLAQL